MGIFDDLRVEYPLPDGWDPAGHVFQTKDTPEQYLARYVLTPYGVLQAEDTGETIRFHGTLTFYTGNACGYAPYGVMTSDDQPEWVAEYTALFDHGCLLRIEGGRQDCPDTRPLISQADWDAAGQRWRDAHPRPAWRPRMPLPLLPGQVDALKTFARQILAIPWGDAFYGAEAQALGIRLGLLELEADPADAQPRPGVQLARWLRAEEDSATTGGEGGVRYGPA